MKAKLIKKRGRDNFYKCAYCGKYISYKEIGDTATISYTSSNPDEDGELAHNKCREEHK